MPRENLTAERALLDIILEGKSRVSSNEAQLFMVSAGVVSWSPGTVAAAQWWRRFRVRYDLSLLPRSRALGAARKKNRVFSIVVRLISKVGAGRLAQRGRH